MLTIWGLVLAAIATGWLGALLAPRSAFARAWYRRVWSGGFALGKGRCTRCFAAAMAGGYGLAGLYLIVALRLPFGPGQLVLGLVVVALPIFVAMLIAERTA